MTKIEQLQTRAIAAMLSMFVECIVAVWWKPCSTRSAGGDRVGGVAHAEQRDHRHQQLVLDERVLLVDLAHEQAQVVAVAARCRSAFAISAGVLADPVLVDVIALEHDLLELLDLARVEPQHRLALELARSGSFAIESTAMTSFSAMQTMLLSSEAPRTIASAAFVEVRGLVDDGRRVARAGADRLLARVHRLP